ncbi:MAG: ATP-grasp domain-containing protein [Gammaproteobacteria bacterium]|jgi:glutathione synthase/RimK-type ligase-like ATP-grasp enzyme|nr:ATP-grasp domain-containing protein [Gammaproteobacteria bacterium]
MTNLIIVDDRSDWPAEIAGARVVDALTYLTAEEFSRGRGLRIFNLCGSYRYQQYGYYVSLLATARGQRPLPDVATIQDLKTRTLPRLASDDLDTVIQRSLRTLESDQFTLSVYFGRNIARRHERLARALFNLFPAPLIRASFRRRDGKWLLENVRAVPAGEIPDSHRDFLLQSIEAHFARRRPTRRRAVPGGYDLAVLANAGEASPPSDARGLRRITRAARRTGFNVELIGRDDFGRLAEFDALFIRETTSVNHHTYRFARRAELEGLVVVDDPISIIRCTNKVYLAEMLRRIGVPTPKTLIVSRRNAAGVGAALGFPCVLKQPDSSFSAGVTRADDQAELDAALKSMLEKSDLVVAQAFLPTDFDWRIGVLDRQPLFACRYYMVDRHWQIYRRSRSGRVSSGRWDTMAVDDVPAEVTDIALRAANVIGNGLYGVDVKQTGERCYVIEVNDNPSLDGGVEDAVLGEALYDRIMSVFLGRVEARKRGRGNG